MSKPQVTRRQFVRDSAGVAAAAAAGATVAGMGAEASGAPDATKTRSYNENMEYRRLGRTNLMISAVSIGGHWKKIPHGYRTPDFKKNRREVLAACMDHGINYIDACWDSEVITYGEAIQGRRDDLFFGLSFGAHESRFPDWARSVKTMKEGFEMGLKAGGLDHVDLWRITMHEQTSARNTPQEIEIAIEVLDWAKKTGKARFTGVSSHDRPWITEAVARYPQLEVIVTPYTAKTKAKPEGSMFDALKKHDVGMIGIKPFASGAVFKSQGQPDSETKQEDDEIARMVLRYVLCCDVLTAAIPGLITIDQVKNAAAAVKQPREFTEAEAARYEELTKDMWDRLPRDYGWLRDWEWV
ncbi:MAG: aldo/keto reductase [Pirellulales bacterium]|nr:aldo/keto reductase [Pirellulales bacterium]